MLDKFQAFQVASELYQGCKELKIHPVLKDRLIRASPSVATHLAEGSGKIGAKDQRRFYAIALGSIRECEAILAQR